MKFSADSVLLEHHDRGVQLEILKADPKTRQRHILFVFVSAVIGGVAVYLVNRHWLRLETELQAKPTPERVAEILAQFKLVFSLVYGVMCLVVVNLFYQALKILRTGQFPLPDAKVIRDTVVLRGQAARNRAFILMGLAAVLGVLFIVLAMMGVRLLEYFQ
jgi:hypothetical protein